MGDLWPAHKKTKLAKNQVLVTYFNGFLYPAYALEPDQFNFAGIILQAGS